MKFELNLKLLDEEERKIVKRVYRFLDKELKKKFLSPAHKIDHYVRVFNLAMLILEKEKVEADPLVIGLATLLHDIGELKSYESKLKHADKSAEIAKKFLKKLGLEETRINSIVYAIKVHRFTKGHIKPKSIEAKILQDADRLDALGSIGLARCLMPAGALDRDLYNKNDPFAISRKLNDKKYTIDHFYVKLLKLPSLMNTKTARKMAKEGLRFLKNF